MGAGASTPGRTKRASSAAEVVSKSPLQTQASTPPNVQLSSANEFEHMRQTFIAEKNKGVSNTELFARLSMKIPDVERDRRAITSAGDAGASTPFDIRPARMNSPVASPTNRRMSVGAVGGAENAKRIRRGQIFEGGFDFADATRIRKMQGAVDRSKEVFQPENKALIQAALGKVFFSDSEGEGLQGAALDRMLDNFEMFSCAEGDFLMKEGEEGNKMYVVISGSLEVSVKGEKVREVTRGDTVGELALLYREVQAVSSSEALVARTKALTATEPLAPVDRYALSRLAGAMTTITLTEGDPPLVVQGSATDKCFLVETGKLEVSSTTVRGKTELERLCGIPSAKLELGAPLPGPTLILTHGGFIGLPVLYCAGGGKRGAWNRAELCRSDNSDAFPGAVLPVSLKALEPMRVYCFTVAQFEATAGLVRDVFSQAILGRPSVLRPQAVVVDVPVEEAEQERFEASDFEMTLFLGTGSFGRVTLVKFKDPARQEKSPSCKGVKHFALKAIAKQAVLDRGQLSHVKDERVLLQALNHPFILRLHGTFQDKNSIFFLTEAVTAGEMWSVVYEALTGWPEGRLPIEHGVFYASCVIEAIAHMHNRGIAYRDLKPENIMMDAQGYLRVIDLGFAKRIPFTITVDGKQELHPKSFTMCGTPEYLAPEFIFNSGHDRSVDYWAFGVLVFELTAGHTPFQPPSEASDMTAVFTRIACSKRDGVYFPADFDKKAKGDSARDLVNKLLQADPSQRLGNMAAGVEGIKHHPYFANTNWPALLRKEVTPPWTPPRPVGKLSEDAGSHKRVPPYLGSQETFADW